MIPQWLGHTSLTTTSRYTHITRSAEQRAAETLDHILGAVV
jgi:site-specific recombinase XerD